MSFTRLQMRTRVLRRLDTVAAQRWDTTSGNTGEVDQVMGFVFDKEWRGLLNANPYLRVSQRTPTADSSGRYAVSTLSVAGERLYRIIAVRIDNAVYEEVYTRDYISATALNVGYRVWFKVGDNIQALPVQAGKVLVAPDGFWVNHIPTRIDDLAADGDTVVFPDGYEEILALESAAFLLAKGGAETNTTAEFKQLATGMRTEMYGDLARVSTKPMRMQYPDNPYDWAG